jgi:hypothetical protein
MKEFKITEPQLQTLAGILGDFPAKHVLPAIDLLRALPEIVHDVKEAIQEATA